MGFVVSREFIVVGVNVAVAVVNVPDSVVLPLFGVVVNIFNDDDGFLVSKQSAFNCVCGNSFVDESE